MAQNALILIIGTPQKVPLVLGNPHLSWSSKLEYFGKLARVSAKTESWSFVKLLCHVGTPPHTTNPSSTAPRLTLYFPT